MRKQNKQNQKTGRSLYEPLTQETAFSGKRHQSEMGLSILTPALGSSEKGKQ